MISKTIEAAINRQINAEYWSAYLYLSMAVHFDAENYKGTANWFYIQNKEEMDHAKMFIDYLIRRGGRVVLEPIAAVPADWDGIQAAFAKTLEHERTVTGLINDLYALAESEKDYATRQMLNWFVSEQVEEENNAQDILDTLNRLGDNHTGLYQFDLELAKRAYTAPAAEL